MSEIPLLYATTSVLPDEHEQATLVSRIQVPQYGGPAVVVLRGDNLVDISSEYATMSDLLESADPAIAAKNATGSESWLLSEVLETSSTPMANCGEKPYFLAPIDLSAVKAAGVTFATSLLERVIEERAGGDLQRAHEIREVITNSIGADVMGIVPGSHEAMALKERFQAEGLWSQYLEVGLGPDPEVFTKAQPLSAMGFGQDIGVSEISKWNNPEPEVVLVVNSVGQIVGATLGNDVNLRDVEGRSALLLPKAKDNNASAAIGPFIRLFDDGFSFDDVRAIDVTLEVEGVDDFSLKDSSTMTKISRDIEELVTSTIGRSHQYPDGLVIYTGTLFSPTQDRYSTGDGFTHAVGDVVRISSPKLGTLANRVNHSEAAAPWTFGVRALIQNLADRGITATVNA